MPPEASRLDTLDTQTEFGILLLSNIVIGIVSEIQKVPNTGVETA